MQWKKSRGNNILNNVQWCKSWQHCNKVMLLCWIKPVFPYEYQTLENEIKGDLLDGFLLNSFFSVILYSWLPTSHSSLCFIYKKFCYFFSFSVYFFNFFFVCSFGLSLGRFCCNIKIYIRRVWLQGLPFVMARRKVWTSVNSFQEIRYI